MAGNGFNMKYLTNKLVQFKQWILSIVMVSCSWKCAIVPIGMIILLGTFKISVTNGFALVIGLCVGSLGEKLSWWENN
jgi:hypothetical protein